MWGYDILETFKEGMETGNFPPVINAQIIRSDGSEAFVEVRASINRDDSGRVVGGRGILQDITERRKVEAREKLNKDKLMILESVGEGIYGVDRSGCCTFINGRGLSMLGYNVKDKGVG
jgi:PAS domain-containing protein